MRIIDYYDIKAMARAVYDAGINLAEGYDEWRNLRFSLAGGGEAMLDSYLMLASMSSKYKEAENRKQFERDVRRSCDKRLLDFVAMCKRNGISPSDFRTPAAIEDIRRRWGNRNNRNSRINRNNNKQSNANIMTTTFNQTTSKPIQTIDPALVTRYRGANDSTFMRSVVATGLLTDEEARAAADLYQLGTSKEKWVVFWEIDAEGRVRDGKAMDYDERCHRVKHSEGGRGSVTWISAEMKRRNRLPRDWEATRCLFGQHLMAQRPLDTICIVESEKTAVILSQKVPDCIWMATGGMGMLNLDKLSALEGRKVILYPDTDPEGEAYKKWYDIAWNAKVRLGMDIIISDVLEKNATPEQKEAKIDLVDFLAAEIEKDAQAAQDKAEEVAQAVPAVPGPEMAKPTTPTAAIPQQHTAEALRKIHEPKDLMDEAELMSPAEMLEDMIESNPNLNYLLESFDTVEVNSS